MTQLKAIKPKQASLPKPKILIFGKPGVGKTWGTLDFPSTYFIDTEGGAKGAQYQDKLEKSGGVYLGPDEGALDFPMVLSQVRALTAEEHPYRTLVIDSITKLFTTSIAEEAERLGDKDAFGASKKPAIGYMRRLVAALMRLDMNVILVAHERSEWGLVNGQRSEIGTTFDCWEKLEYELDLCFQVEKRGPSRTARARKSRMEDVFKEGQSFPWSYAEFAKRYGQDTIERQSQAIDLATPEQIAEIARLVKLAPEGWEARAFKKAGVESWVDMEADKAAKCITCLKTKYLNPKEKETKQ